MTAEIPAEQEVSYLLLYLWLPQDEPSEIV